MGIKKVICDGNCGGCQFYKWQMDENRQPIFRCDAEKFREYEEKSSTCSILSTPLARDHSPLLPTVEDIRRNRGYNRRNFKHTPLPEAKRAIVVGAGKSVDYDLLGKICFKDYDVVLLTYPMANHFSYLINFGHTFVVDGEFIETSIHYYGKWMVSVRLICPWEKKLDIDWALKSVTFLSPEKAFDLDYNNRIATNYPKSTGAIALQVALEDMGGKTLVDVIGIDCNEGAYRQSKEETLAVINKHRDRVNLIGCGIDSAEGDNCEI